MSQSSDPSQIDHPVRGYTDIRLLRQDRLGRVFAARKDSDNSLVALRRLPEGVFTATDAAQPLETLVQTLSSVRDDRVTPLWTVTGSGGGAVAGGLPEAVPLTALLESGALAPAAAAVVLSEVLGALTAIAEGGLVHGELGAEHVGVGLDGGVTVRDTGLAVALGLADSPSHAADTAAAVLLAEKCLVELDGTVTGSPFAGLLSEARLGSSQLGSHAEALLDKRLGEGWRNQGRQMLGMLALLQADQLPGAMISGMSGDAPVRLEGTPVRPPRPIAAGRRRPGRLVVAAAAGCLTVALSVVVLGHLQASPVATTVAPQVVPFTAPPVTATPAPRDAKAPAPAPPTPPPTPTPLPAPPPALQLQSPTPSPVPTPTPSPTPSATPTPTSIPTPTPSATPCPSPIVPATPALPPTC